MKTRYFRGKRGLWAGMVLLLAILACNAPMPDEGPSLAGTVAYEPGDSVAPVDAKETIRTYAREVLGLEIPELVAGGKSGELNLPVSTMDGVQVAIGLAGTTYVGVWRQGAASLSFGDSEVGGDLYADVQDGSLHHYDSTDRVTFSGDGAIPGRRVNGRWRERVTDTLRLGDKIVKIVATARL
jgi:hypothetical protein